MRLALLALALLLVPAASAQLSSGAMLTVSDIVTPDGTPMQEGDSRVFRFTATRTCGHAAQVLPAATLAWRFEADGNAVVTGAETMVFRQQACAQQPAQAVEFTAKVHHLGFDDGPNATAPARYLRVVATSDYRADGAGPGGYTNDVRFELAFPVNVTQPPVAVA
ncbi:MAG TPA: hypothetical protein VFH47_04990, partial [Candidatus Thermoplasmatota archaeon]|nr:hypothetical protein [Candidatus Thermoplasmatota archaeon]